MFRQILVNLLTNSLDATGQGDHISVTVSTRSPHSASLEVSDTGCGISKEDLAKRIIFATDKDLRYYLMQYIEQEKVLHPHAMHQWKFIPEEWTVPAAKKDYQLLFGEEKK